MKAQQMEMQDNDALAEFRREWKDEVNNKFRGQHQSRQQNGYKTQQNKREQQVPPQLPQPSSSTNNSNALEEKVLKEPEASTIESTLPSSSSATTTTTVTSDGRNHFVDGIPVSHSNRRMKGFKESNPLMLYEKAIEFEQQGKMHDALVYYQAAFRANEKIDRLYHQYKTSQKPFPEFQKDKYDQDSKKSEGLDVTDNEVDHLSFKFKRTLQVHPDYEGTKPVESEEDHPSSTRRLFVRLIKSFKQHPFVPVDPETEVDYKQEEEKAHEKEKEAKNDNNNTVIEAKEKPKYVHLDEPDPNYEPEFVPINENEPLAITRLPLETLGHVLQHVVQPSQEPYYPHVTYLERFAKVSRKARLASLDNSIWSRICKQVFVPPHQLHESDSAESIVKKHHGNDWRRMWIEHPRIRTDGVFIAIITYHRSAQTSASFTAGPHYIVTYYRYLRFYSDGTVLSLLTTAEPDVIVRDLDLSLKMKGLTKGRWRLRGRHVVCWDLQDASGHRNRSEFRYSFVLEATLKSTSRGRMNKMEIIDVSTVNLNTMERASVPIHNEKAKPFYFSKVNSYEK